MKNIIKNMILWNVKLHTRFVHKIEMSYAGIKCLPIAAVYW